MSSETLYQIIFMRFQEKKTVAEIAGVFGISQFLVNQIIMNEVYEIEYWKRIDKKPVYAKDGYLKYWHTDKSYKKHG